MKFEWHEIHDRLGDGRPAWGLYMVHKDRYQRVIGTITKLSRAWRVMDINPGKQPDFYWLDGDLTLEDAQRAAKLFLCVGRQ